MRNSVIDTMKAIGILLVVMFHSLGEVGFSKFISFNMPLFFFLSGWAGVSKKNNPKTTLKKLFTRLLYVYFFFNVFVSLAKFFLPSLCDEGKLVGFPQFIWDPFSAPMQISWFLYVLFIIKIINLIINKMTMFDNCYYSISLIIIVAYFASKQLELGNLSTILIYLFYYYVGICVRRIDTVIDIKYYIAFIPAFILILANNFKILDINSIIYCLLGIYSIFIISLILNKSIFKNIFIYIGENTMSIYLFHYFVQVAIRGRLYFFPQYAQLLVTLIVSVLLSIFIGIVVKKVRVLDKVVLGNFQVS